MTSRTYQVAIGQLLRQAREELTAGDVRQASEKGWGAAAQILKAIAARRDWEHQGHGKRNPPPMPSWDTCGRCSGARACSWLMSTRRT